MWLRGGILLHTVNCKTYSTFWDQKQIQSLTEEKHVAIFTNFKYIFE